LCLWNPGRDLEDVYSERWFGAVHVSRRALVGWLFVIESRQRIGEMTGSDQVPRGLVRLAKKRRAPRCHPPCSGNLLPQRFLGSTWGTRTRSEGNQTNPGCILIAPRCDSQTTALLQARLRMQVRKPGREDSQTKNMFVPMYLLGFLCAASTTRHLQPESPRHNVGATLIVLATLISHAPSRSYCYCVGTCTNKYQRLLPTLPIASHRNFSRNPGSKLSRELDQHGFSMLRQPGWRCRAHLKVQAANQVTAKAGLESTERQPEPGTTRIFRSEI
jgi:hypothetical protein